MVCIFTLQPVLKLFEGYSSPWPYFISYTKVNTLSLTINFVSLIDFQAALIMTTWLSVLAGQPDPKKNQNQNTQILTVFLLYFPLLMARYLKQVSNQQVSNLSC